MPPPAITWCSTQPFSPKLTVLTSTFSRNVPNQPVCAGRDPAVVWAGASPLLQHHGLAMARTGFVPLQIQGLVRLVGTGADPAPSGGQRAQLNLGEVLVLGKGVGSLMGFNHTTYFTYYFYNFISCFLSYILVLHISVLLLYIRFLFLYFCIFNFFLYFQYFICYFYIFLTYILFLSFPCPCPRTATLGPGNHPPVFSFTACRWLRCDVGLEMAGADIVWG